LDLQFASSELQRLYTDDFGADKYSTETVKRFRRRIRHIEAAKDLHDLQCPSGVQYRQLGSGSPRKSSLALDESWDLIISEQDSQGSKQIVVLEISKREWGNS
jgi:plasmid maintenance system killer protein